MSARSDIQGRIRFGEDFGLRPPGRGKQALAMMEESNRSQIDPVFLCIATGPSLGDLHGAFACMRKACKDNPGYLIAPRASADDAVRKDPRFKDALACVNLAS